MFNLLYLYSTSRLGVELGVWGDETEVNLSAPKTTTLNVYLLSYLKNYLDTVHTCVLQRIHFTLVSMF